MDMNEFPSDYLHTDQTPQTDDIPEDQRDEEPLGRAPTRRVLEGNAEMVIDEPANIVFESFQVFLETFEEIEDGIRRFPYIVQILALCEEENSTVYVDLEHVYNVDTDLYTSLVNEYLRVEPYLERAVLNVALTGSKKAMRNIKRGWWVCFYNQGHCKRLREIRTRDIGTLVTITGTVNR